MGIIHKIMGIQTEDDTLFYSEMKEILGFSPKNIFLYQNAFLHSSKKQVDINGVPQNYERLEFLGDAMLSAVIAAYLYKKVPLGNEGYLTKMRSKIVSREKLNEIGEDLNLIQFIQTNISSSKYGNNIYGNILESLIGAIYLDRGYKYCKIFIQKKILIPYINFERLEGKVISFKSLFIEWCQKRKQKFYFEAYEDTGKDKIKQFSVKLYLDDRLITKGRGPSKKKAEEIAAQRACYADEEIIETIRNNT